MKTIIAILLFASVQLAFGLTCHNCTYSNIAKPAEGLKVCHVNPDKSATLNCTDLAGKFTYCTTAFGVKEGNVTITRACKVADNEVKDDCVKVPDADGYEIETCFCKDKDLCNNKNLSGASIISVFFLLPIMGLIANFF